MSVIISEQKARDIISRCEKIESFTAIVKAEMKAVLGSVGTPQDKRKVSKSKRQEKLEAEIRAKFHNK